MYNPDIIRVLMARKSVSTTAVLEALGASPRQSLTHLLYRNIGVDRLEALASIFEVPVDAFFTKDGESVKSKVSNVMMQAQLASNSELVTSLLEEKDKRIKLLESTIEDLKRQIDALNSGTPQGQNAQK